jgi:hypothetical protein
MEYGTLIFRQVAIITFSRAKLNKRHNKASPCLSPFLVSEDSVIPLKVLTLHLTVLKVSSTKHLRFLGT